MLPIQARWQVAGVSVAMSWVSAVQIWVVVEVGTIAVPPRTTVITRSVEGPVTS